MKFVVLIGVATVIWNSSLAQIMSQELPKDLLTVAERSDWQATASHADVMELILRVDAKSSLVHVEEAGKTFEKKSLPILVIADPPVRKPEDVGDRLVAFAWAGIHSGEVCGKPATLMLAQGVNYAAQSPAFEGFGRHIYATP